MYLRIKFVKDTSAIGRHINTIAVINYPNLPRTAFFKHRGDCITGKSSLPGKSEWLITLAELPYKVYEMELQVGHLTVRLKDNL
jgi:hypothetical protein